MITNHIRDPRLVRKVITRKGWGYGVVPGTYQDDGDSAVFEAFTKHPGETQRVVIRVDEIATVVELQTSADR